MKAENDYKKQIRELQSALETERRKNTAMAKGLIPKEYLQTYARIQIEKDREKVIKECTEYHEWECQCMADSHGYIKADRNRIKDLPINLD